MDKKALFGLAAAAVVAVFSLGSILPALAADASKGAAGGGRHRVVFEVTMDGTEQWTAVLNNVENLKKAFGATNTEVEVVGHSKGLGMMLAKNAELAERMKRIADGGVVFAACENTMRKKNVTKADLLPFVTTVDSGVAEVVRKQEAGWSYLKSGI